MVSIGPTAAALLLRITVNSLPRKPWNHGFYRAHSRSSITVYYHQPWKPLALLLKPLLLYGLDPLS